MQISPAAAAAAGARLPDRKTVAAAKRDLAAQMERAQASRAAADEDDDDDGENDDFEGDADEDEEDEGLGGVESFSPPRSSSQVVLEEQRQRAKQEQQAVWQERARAWRGAGECIGLANVKLI